MSKDEAEFFEIFAGSVCLVAGASCLIFGFHVNPPISIMFGIPLLMLAGLAYYLAYLIHNDL